MASAAKRLGISRSAAYELVQSGRLVAHKINSRTVILDADLVEFVEALPLVEADA